MVAMPPQSPIGGASESPVGVTFRLTAPDAVPELLPSAGRGRLWKQFGLQTGFEPPGDSAFDQDSET